MFNRPLFLLAVCFLLVVVSLLAPVRVSMAQPVMSDDDATASRAEVPNEVIINHSSDSNYAKSLKLIAMQWLIEDLVSNQKTTFKKEVNGLARSSLWFFSFEKNHNIMGIINFTQQQSHEYVIANKSIGNRNFRGLNFSYEMNAWAYYESLWEKKRIENNRWGNVTYQNERVFSGNMRSAFSNSTIIMAFVFSMFFWGWFQFSGTTLRFIDAYDRLRRLNGEWKLGNYISVSGNYAKVSNNKESSLEKLRGYLYDRRIYKKLKFLLVECKNNKSSQRSWPLVC